MNKAIIYIRVSTDEQAIKGYSMKNQEEQLMRYCKINNIAVLKIIYEDHSAKTFNRPEWKSMLKSLNQKRTERPDLILFTRWDRFSRNAGDAYYMIALLKRMNIEVQAIEQILDLSIPENKLVLALYLAVSEVENDRKALNIKRALHKAKQEGRWMGPAPKGYANRTTKMGSKQIVPIEPEATMIRDIFTRIAEGNITIRGIYRNAVKSGFKCSLHNFYTLIRNPVYCGKIKISDFENEKGYLVAGIHEGLISERLFEKVQEILDGRSKKAIRKSKNTHFPFRGILICPNCSRMLTGSVSKGSRSYYAYYHCYNGCKFRIRASNIDEQFVELLQGFNLPDIVMDLFRIIIKRQFDSYRKDYALKHQQITKNLERLFDRSIKAKELLLKGEIDDEDYSIIKSDCESKINSIGQNFLQVTSDITGLQNNIDKMISQFLPLDQFFLRLPFEQKVRMIRLILKSKVIPTEKISLNNVNDIINTIADRKTFEYKRMIEYTEKPIRPEYDQESESIYNELIKENNYNTTKAGTIFWRRFPEIVFLLKEMVSLINATN